MVMVNCKLLIVYCIVVETMNKNSCKLTIQFANINTVSELIDMNLTIGDFNLFNRPFFFHFCK